MELGEDEELDEEEGRGWGDVEKEWVMEVGVPSFPSSPPPPPTPSSSSS